MQFTQIEFLIFLGLILLAVWRCRTRVPRNLILLAASYYFYSYWDYRFCGLLLLSTAVDFFVARRISNAVASRGKRAWLCVSLGVNLGVLGFFKYFNFFIESATPLIESAGLNAGTLNIILPVGISFYTFQTLSYTIDVYRGKIRPTDSLLDFALYVAFFPQLVAGPIVRASELLPQLSRRPNWSSRRFYGGFQLALCGLVKKVLLADRLGEVVDVVFAAPQLYGGLTVWLAVIGYAGQIYYDFSGYTDIAIGVAKMLGYRFPKNFRHPYLATSVADFWHRWHMTLSRWLRDYLYIPLGGSRCGGFRTNVNLIITMVLGGLWHGAAWTFVLWGLWHGTALVCERELRRRYELRKAVWLGRLSTFLVVVFGWVLFRSTSLDQFASITRQMLFQSPGMDWYPPLAIAAIGIMVLEHAAWTTRMRIAMRLRAERWYTPIVTTVMIWCLVLYAPRGFTPFVYFQF
ncbi:Peptidoglycan O-acetyltransferase [Stieleria neptunia]|uniref:Peptidoglycan O-acetyltransferase n=1 Tax=Stieleria neptunia TaxID=2527979 RepID=A0A518HUT2_9BACT|nr:MBOAT family protein [Stieleria neptunia]QDV44615.1 Peptidoglycan O-acetyltransferase [Stieleria neptunia]